TNGSPAKFSCQVLGALKRAIRNEHRTRAFLGEMSDAGFTHLARADDHDCPGGEIFIEYALGEFDGNAADRCCAAANGGLCANFFGNLESALEKTIGDATSQFDVLGSLISLFDLAGDFGFAENHGIEATGD